jgi:hypothetical protein
VKTTQHVWRTEDGRYVPNGHPDAAILAYATGDEVPSGVIAALSPEDPQEAPEPEEPEEPAAAESEEPPLADVEDPEPEEPAAAEALPEVVEISDKATTRRPSRHRPGR